MDLMYGVIIGFFCGLFCFGIGLVMGWYIFGSRRSHKPVHKEVDEEQARKAQQLRRGFEQLMSYDVSKATGKKVT